MRNYAKEIWDMANKLRGKRDPIEYQYFILGFIVYRYLSSKQADYLCQFLDRPLYKKTDKADNDSERRMQHQFNQEYLEIDKYQSYVKQALNTLGYAIKPQDTWVTLTEKAKNKELTMEDFQNIFSHFDENLLDGSKYPGDFKGIFSGINLANVGNDGAASMASALTSLVLEIDNIDVYDEHGHDILGDIYEELIAQFASNSGKKAGEFYTPHMVSRLLAKLTTSNLKEKQKLEIMDFAMGSGALLLTYADVAPGGQEMIDFYGQELNGNTFNLARMNLMMHGVDHKNMILRNGDTLGKDWPSDKKMDIISANPPYSADWDNTAEREQDPRFSGYAIPPKSKADYAFLLHGLYHLKNDGTMGIVLPHGVLFREAKEGKIRKQLIESNIIDAVIGLPSKLFYSTSIPTIIVILKKNKVTNDIMFIDASKKFEKDGKQNILTDDIISNIVKTYKARKDVDKYAHVASYDEIKENDFNLNIPRYVDTFEPEPDIDLGEVETKLSDIDNEIQQAQKEFDDMKADLVKTDVNINDK